MIAKAIKKMGLLFAISNLDLVEVRALLSSGADPNELTPQSAGGDEDPSQPDRPLKMVLFRVSDCMLSAAQHVVLTSIAIVLIKYGADPVPALVHAEIRYGRTTSSGGVTGALVAILTSAGTEYERAEAALIELQSTRTVLRKKQGKPRPSSATEVASLMQHYADRIGLDLGSTKVLHVAGTKGKGSVCAMSDSILRAHGLATGMFTSPHLIEYRERIRIGGRPLSRAKFAKYFWATLRALQCTATDGAEYPSMPAFFRFMTLFALKAFVDEGVDAIVLEVGIGGRLDSTNFLPPSAVTACAVTTLDLDHVAILGDTLELIAAEKAGIFKSGVCAISTPTQTPGALEVLQRVAATVGAPFELAPPLAADVPLGLSGAFQRNNAAIALRLCQVALEIPRGGEGGSLSPETLQGLASASWAGRAQTVREQALRHAAWSDAAFDVAIHLDGAHTPLSAQCCADWYRTQSTQSQRKNGSRSVRALVFNCGSRRDPVSLLRPLLGLSFDVAIFCPPDFDKPTAVGDPAGDVLLGPVLGDDPPALAAALAALEEEESAALAAAASATAAGGGAALDDLDAAHSALLWQRRLAAVWTALGGAPASTVRSVGEAMHACRRGAEAALEARVGGGGEGGEGGGASIDVLVTGSIYLVGSTLAALGWSEDVEDAVETS